jgi:tRNA (mo5U34)-methyltransferase
MRTALIAALKRTDSGALRAGLPLAGRSVLEVGCFEGIHTIGLGQRAAKVIAIDSRIENVVKTMVRTWSFGLHVTCFQCDVERAQDFALVPEVDITHHVGVLYHLKDPVAHLQALLARTKQVLMLDTHVAAEGEATASYEVGGRSYPYRHYREGGRADAFSGMYDHAKWLPVDVLASLLREQGFGEVDVAELRPERNGLRALIFAKRTR